MPAALPDFVNEARDKVTQAGDYMQGFAGKEYTISDELKKILNAGTQEGKTDWANIRSTTLSDYLAEPQKARAAYRDPESANYIFNPAQSARAMAQDVQTKEIPFMTANTLFGMFTDQEGDIIQSGANVFNAQQAAARSAYDVARQTYSDVLDEFRLQEQLRAQEEAERMDRERFALDREKFQLEKTKGGSGSDLGSVFDYMAALLGGEQQLPSQSLSGLDAALEEPEPFEGDPLLGPVYQQQQKKKQDDNFSNKLKGLKVNLNPQTQPSSGLSIAGKSPYSFGNLNMGGINLGGY